MSRAVWLLAGLAVAVAAIVAGLYLAQTPTSRANASRSSQTTVEKARRALIADAFNDVLRLTRGVDDAQPDAAEMRLWRGIALWRLDRWQEAEDEWRRALEINPQVPEASWRLLIMYFYQQRFEEAEDLALKVYPIEPDPDDRARLLLELIRQYIRQDGDLAGTEAAVMTLEPVLASEPDNPHVLRAVGLSYIQLGRMRDGAELIERARSLRPDDPQAAYARARYLSQSGQLQKFGEEWDRLPAAAREQARLLFYRGQWAEQVGDTAEAERAYRAAIQHDATDRKAHDQLASLLRAAGRRDEAEPVEAKRRELDEAREALAAAYMRTTQEDFVLSSDDCREFARLCERLGRIRQAQSWDLEAQRRAARRVENR
jgi:tetratricopeptide (TPR) repeat protein